MLKKSTTGYQKWLCVLVCCGVQLISWGGCSSVQIPLVQHALQQGPPGLPSRRFQQTPEGFYFQPTGLADDFPEETTTHERIVRDLETLQSVGARYFRFGIGWDGIEEQPGKYRWNYWDELVELAPKYGITLIPYVCYTPPWTHASSKEKGKKKDEEKDFWRKPPRDLKKFGQFMYVIASRYRGQIRSWELWNEPDIQNYWLGTPGQFAKMVLEGARQVRRADPNAILVLGGMSHSRSPFLDSMIEKYHVDSAFDVINLHGYLETWDSERAEQYPLRIQSVRHLINDTTRGVDLWLAEFGYSNYQQTPTSASEWSYIVHNYEHTTEFQAVALWRHHVLALASEDLSLSTWYRIHDLPINEKVIGDNNNKFLGILDILGKPKPAFYAMKLYNSLFNLPVRSALSKVQIHAPKNSQSVVYVFEKANRDFLVTAWLRSSTREESNTSKPANLPGNLVDQRSETLSIQLPMEKKGTLIIYDLKGNKILEQDLKINSALREINLQGNNVFIAEIRQRD